MREKPKARVRGLEVLDVLDLIQGSTCLSSAELKAPSERLRTDHVNFGIPLEVDAADVSDDVGSFAGFGVALHDTVQVIGDVQLEVVGAECDDGGGVLFGNFNSVI